MRVDATGIVPSPPGSELTERVTSNFSRRRSAGAIRLAARKTRNRSTSPKADRHDDDTRRIAWLDDRVAEVEQCIARGST
jgi:hypothetical protein